MSSPRYLIVSDDPAIHDLVARRLRADGAEVDTTSGLEEAYEMLAAAPYRAVLLDLSAARGGHLVLLASRTIENRQTPFVVLLGTSELQRQWAEEFGAACILEKLHTDLAGVVKALKDAGRSGA